MLDILGGIGGFFADLIMGFVSLPIFPDGVQEFTEIVFTWISAGINIIDVFCPLEAIAPAIVFFLAVFVVHKVYFIVLWVLNKIPAIDID